MQQNGRCPLAGCAQPTTVADIRELIFDPPQPNGVPIDEQAGQQVYFCQFNKNLAKKC
jgi:hypothetical protein